MVLYLEPAADDPSDSGLSLLRADAPRPLDADAPRQLFCLDCVLDEWPGVGRGLDLAREYGEARLSESGEWKANV